MAWSDHERPGDVLRAVARLDMDHRDRESYLIVARVLGLAPPEQPAELAPPPTGEPVVPPAEMSSARQFTRAALAAVFRVVRWARDHLGRTALLLTVLFVVAAAVTSRYGAESIVALGATMAAGGVLYLFIFLVLARIWVAIRTRIGLWRWRRRQAPATTEDRDRLDAPAPAADPPPPLIEPRRAPAVAHALASAPLPTGRPDLLIAARRIAQGRSAIPFAPEVSMRLVERAVVLLDTGDAMTPLRHDARDVLAALEGVLGTDRLTVLKFRDRPEDGVGQGPLRTWRPFDDRLALPGTRILVISDAGAATRHPAERRARAEVIAAMAREWSAAGALPLLFTPYRACRYPPLVNSLYAVVRWSEHVTEREIAAIVRAAA